MEPNDFVRLRPRRDGALEVDVVALGDVVRIEAGAQFQEDHRGICNRSNQISSLERSTGFLKLFESRVASGRLTQPTKRTVKTSLTVDGELPLVFYGGAGDLGVLRPTRQRLALVAVTRPELQHGARQVPVGQNLRSVDGTRLLAECATILAQPIPSECTG